jgi:dTDP-4-dehydrorhamnose reductase
MRILLLGKEGQVGWELQRSLAPLGEVVALGRQGTDGLTGDLVELDGVQATVRAVAPDVLVNAAAYTAVDRAEREPERSMRINGEACGVLARTMRELGGWLVHYSTDYVFDGNGDRPWQESDFPAPVNHYGLSKLAGEQAIRESGVQHLLLRTSWVYAARGANFPKTMLRLARERPVLKVVADQVGAPTGAELVADVTAHVLRAALSRPDVAGTYHLAASGACSWHECARFVVDEARRLSYELAVKAVEPTASADYPTPARRPLNSRLDTTRLCTTFGLTLPPWQAGLSRMLSELINEAA